MKFEALGVSQCHVTEKNNEEKMKFNFQCRTLACKGVVSNEDGPLTTICAFLEENGFSGAVLDLWTTGCTHCPAKLDEVRL